MFGDDSKNKLPPYGKSSSEFRENLITLKNSSTQIISVFFYTFALHRSMQCNEMVSRRNVSDSKIGICQHKHRNDVQRKMRRKRFTWYTYISTIERNGGVDGKSCDYWKVSVTDCKAFTWKRIVHDDLSHDWSVRIVDVWSSKILFDKCKLTSKVTNMHNIFKNNSS